MIQPNFSLISAVFVTLVLVSIGYNTLVAWLERSGYIEGFTSLVVAVGVLITLGGVAVISWQAALLALGAFVATGTPMIAGSIWRYIQLRREAQGYERQTARMAEHGEISPGPGR
jgi:hypothetical protein